MSNAGEMRGFVFAVIFIIIFGTLIASIPVGLQGPAETVDIVTPIDPQILTGFAETEQWFEGNYTPAFPFDFYDYTLGGIDYRSHKDDSTSINLGAKVLFFVFWFGAIDYCEFESEAGTDRGITLEFSEIDLDDDEGTAQYSLTFQDSGNTAGTFIAHWNITEHSTFTDAWNADEAYLLHGIGIESTATTNIGSLIVSLLFLQLPNVPVLINIFIVVPIWAAIIYVLWYIIKEMIPFV